MHSTGLPVFSAHALRAQICVHRLAEPTLMMVQFSDGDCR